MAVSRILSWTIIYLSSAFAEPPDPAEAGPWCDDTRGLTSRLPGLCFVLHRMGFFLPRESLRER